MLDKKCARIGCHNPPHPKNGKWCSKSCAPYARLLGSEIYRPVKKAPLTEKKPLEPTTDRRMSLYKSWENIAQHPKDDSKRAAKKKALRKKRVIKPNRWLDLWREKKTRDME